MLGSMGDERGIRERVSFCWLKRVWWGNCYGVYRYKCVFIWNSFYYGKNFVEIRCIDWNIIFLFF